MIEVGIGQIIAGTLLILTGWMVSTGQHNPTFGAIVAGIGIFILYKSVQRKDPPGV